MSRLPASGMGRPAHHPPAASGRPSTARNGAVLPRSVGMRGQRYEGLREGSGGSTRTPPPSSGLLQSQAVNRLGPNGWDRSISSCPREEVDGALAARIFMPATAAAVRLETPSLCSSAVT